jgi:CubicO group peptidase (beta-lactamase class C family)
MLTRVLRLLAAAVVTTAIFFGAFNSAAQAVETTGAAANYFPPAGSGAEWKTIDAAEAGFDRAKLDEVLEFARQQRSSGLVILYRGRIVAEGYWNPNDVSIDRKAMSFKKLGYDQRVVGRDAAGRAIEDVASAQKSISSMLAGIAQHRGMLKISDPVHKYLGPGWSQASTEQESDITIRHLLTMTSGLDEELKFTAPPGTRWFYNTTAYSRVLMCTAAAAKLDRHDLTKQWLTGPIGMADSRWVERPNLGGAAARNEVGFATTARDLARFGILIQANGEWDGRVIIEDKQFLHDALHPSQELNPSYGYLWWLNGQSHVMRGRQKVLGSLIPTAPADLVAAMGAFQRKLYVVPSQHLIVTRLGDECPPLDANLWRLIMAARVEK